MASYIVYFREEGPDYGYYGVTTIEANSKKHAFMKFQNQMLQNKYKIIDIYKNTELYLGVYSNTYYNNYITPTDITFNTTNTLYNNTYITPVATISSGTSDTTIAFDNIEDNYFYYAQRVSDGR